MVTCTFLPGDESQWSSRCGSNSATCRGDAEWTATYRAPTPSIVPSRQGVTDGVLRNPHVTLNPAPATQMLPSVYTACRKKEETILWQLHQIRTHTVPVTCKI